MNKKIQALHEQAVEASQSFLRAERKLIGLLQEIDDLRGYRELDCKSLHEYATRALKLSDAVAYTLITLARKSKTVPALKDKIESEALTISNARMIAPILTPANQTEWILKAEVLPKRELERELKREFPELISPERSRYVTEDRMELKVGVSEKVHRELKRVQDLLCQKTGKAATLEETLAAMAEVYLEKHDPLKKAERALERKKSSPHGEQTLVAPKLVPGPNIPLPRMPLPNAILHAIRLRDQNRCTYGEPHQRCAEVRWLDVHHVILRSAGGSDTIENLVTLCRAHHQMQHR
jgi:hypothetical protein